MSSLRNAVKRKTHKERSQPQSRAKFGLLEKKKDYVVRAKDFHRKEDRLSAMSRRVENRNPDEFYFGMNKSKVVDGKHRFEKDSGLDADTLRVMKSQDLGYVSTKARIDKKKIETLKARFQNSEGTKNKKLKFVSHDDEENLGLFDDDDVDGDVSIDEEENENGNNENFDDDEYDLDLTKLIDPTIKVSEKEKRSAERRQRKQEKKIERARISGYNELKERVERARKLDIAASHLATEKLVQGKGTKRKVRDAVGGKPALYKFKRIRQK